MVRAMMAALVALVAALPATAAPATGEELAAQRAVGQCIASREGQRSATLLRTAPGSPAEASSLANMKAVLAKCTAGTTQPPLPILRGLLAERLYLKRMPRSRAAQLAPPEPMGVSLPGISKMFELAGSDMPAYRTATCMALTRWDTADLLVRTAPGSPEEAAQFGSLATGLPGCIEDGERVSLDRASLRIMIAEALYREIPPDGFDHRVETVVIRER